MKKLLSMILVCVLLCTVVLAFAACGKPNASTYFETRSTEGRKIYYCEMVVKGYDESVILLLDATTAPLSVGRFIELVMTGFYDGLTFHRVMENFMIQGGQKSGSTFSKLYGEFDNNGHKNDIKHLRGTISLARTDDMDGASSQFFICNADYPSLDGNYAAFGYVISGMVTVDKITEDTVPYADASSGQISDSTKCAVIESIRMMAEEDALAKAAK